MPAAKPVFYITTPIYYVNDNPHIGHAYTTLACDVMARFMRLDGHEVMFLTGTDEHGQKVEKAADEAGIAPQEFCDKVSENFRNLAKEWNFSHDDFIRTTEQRHIRSVQALWRRLEQAGAIYRGQYEGWYAVRDEAFYGEDELIDDGAGTRLAPTGAPVERVKEPSYFFRLSAWQERLLDLYERQPDFIAPESRRNEVKSFVASGLRDLSISRTSFSWGVPVPGDPAHVMYVWIDALTNYITAAGYPEQDGAFTRLWPAFHMVGKDILRFHAVYWPAFLMAAGLEVPRRVFAHGWWTSEGQKISKSLGNVIVPSQIVARYGLDQVRYTLMREVAFGNDGDFSHRGAVRRCNHDLANEYGNLAQRVLAMIARNGGAQVPTPGARTAADRALLDSAYGLLPVIRRHVVDTQAFHLMLQAIWQVVGAANRYVDEQAPWVLRKKDPERMATVLYILAETVRVLALLTQPTMPHSSARLLDQLAVAADERGFDRLTAACALRPGTPLPAPEPVFPRYQEKGEGRA